MKFKDIIYKHFDTLETIFLLIFAAGLIAIFNEVTNAKYILGAGAGLLSVLYLIRSNQKSEDKKFDITNKIAWYGLIITPLALYAKIQIYEESNILLEIALAILAIALILKIYQKVKDKNKVKNADIIRLVIAIIITLVLFALPLPKLN